MSVNKSEICQYCRVDLPSCTPRFDASIDRAGGPINFPNVFHMIYGAVLQFDTVRLQAPEQHNINSVRASLYPKLSMTFGTLDYPTYLQSRD